MNKKTKKVLIITIPIAIAFILLIVFLNSNVFQQSVLSSSSVQLNNGKVYWLQTINVNGNGDTFTYLPSKYTFQDGSGTTVTPQKQLSLTFSKQDSYCEYQLMSQTYSGCLGLLKADYYILSNPERIADVKISDGYQQTQVMDATRTGESVSFYGAGGSATVQAQGTLGGKTDCPNYENVVVAKATDGISYAFNRDEYNNFVKSQSCLGLLTLKVLYSPKPALNNQFTSAFKSYPTIGSTLLRGYLDLGTGVFTVTADQSYFQSVIYTPPKIIKPRIQSINLIDVIQGTSSSISVVISNEDTGEGTIQVTATSPDISIVPSFQNINIASKGTINTYFTITAPDKVETSKICIKACSSSQFDATSNNCDEQCKNINILSDGTITSKCGDNVCNINENMAICPQDCKLNCSTTQHEVAGKCIDNLICKWYQTKTADTIDYGLFGWRKLFNNPKIIEGTCKNPDLITIVIIGSFTLLIVIIIITAITPKKNVRSRGKS